MKILLSLALLLCTFTAEAEERTITVGMPEAEAKTALKMVGKDITAGMSYDAFGPKEGVVWECDKYKVVLTLSCVNGKVDKIFHNTLKDFTNSKSVRAQNEKEITSATFDTAQETCAVK